MKLSIITINYNNLAGLKKTAESVMSQTFKDYEWIVIDGGSTDGSSEYLEQISECITFWVSEKDSGIYNAMNKGIERARGEYLNFMNSGDCYADDTTLQYVMGVERHADILYGYMVRKTIDGVVNNLSIMKEHIDWYDFFNDTIPHQSSYIRKKLFDTIGRYDESYKAVADWKFFILAIVHNDASYEFLPQKLSIYEGGGISDDRNGIIIERDRLRKEMFPSVTNDDIEKIKCYNKIQSIPVLRRVYYILLKITDKWLSLTK